MSYSLYLADRVTKETLDLPFKHVMIGGTFEADYDEKTGMFSPKPISAARLNITYNYSQYYYAATKDLFDEPEQNLGIRAIYGKTGLESIPILEHIIHYIETEYPELESDDDYWEACPGNAIRPIYQLKVMAELRPDGIWMGD